MHSATLVNYIPFMRSINPNNIGSFLQVEPFFFTYQLQVTGYSVFLFPSLSNNFFKCRSVSGMGSRVNKKVSIVPVIVPVWLKNETKKEEDIYS